MSNFASRIIRTKGNKLLVPRHNRGTNDSYHKAVNDASGIVFEEFLQHVKIQEATSKKKKLDIWIHILSFIDEKMDTILSFIDDKMDTILSFIDDKKDTILSFMDDKKNIILSFIDDKGTDKSIVVYNQFCAF